MKNLSIFRKLVIITIFIILGIIIIIIAVNLNKQSDAETIAKSVLNKTYGITLEDSKNLANAITQSAEDNTVLLKYLHSIYEEQITDNGYNAIINNRIPSKVVTTATEENSDLKVTSIQLESRDAINGSKRYTYTVEVEKVKETTKTFIFKGSIVLIQENGHWKADGMTPQ